MMSLPTLSHAAVDAYDHLLLPVWLFSPESLQILKTNPAAQDWLGYDAQTLQKMTIADLRPEHERTQLVERLREFDDSPTDAGTWTIVTKSGAHFTVSFGWTKVIFDGAEAIVATIRDVTHITQAESRAEALTERNEELHRHARVSAEHLWRLVDGLPGKMLVLRPGDFEITAVTDEYAQAVMAEPDTLIGRRLFEVFPDDPSEPEADGVRNLHASLQRIEALRATDVMNVQRYPVRRPDGTFEERFWLPRNKPVLDAEGEVIYIVHRVEDVTGILDEKDSCQADASLSCESGDNIQLAEARVALHALRERETRLKTAEKLLNLGAWEYDLERGRLNWSDRVFEIYGVPPEEGAPDFDDYVALVHPDDREQMLSTYNDFFETGAPEIEFQHRITREDGTISHIHGVGARHRAEDRDIVIGFVQDITAIKATEEELRNQARRRRLAGKLANLGSWRVKIGDTHAVWDEETAAIHDEPEGTLPTVEDAIAYYVPEHRDRIRARFEACAQTGTPFNETLQIKTGKGRRVWVRAAGEPVLDDEGRIVAVEGAFQDITDLIAARDEAANLSARLRWTLEGMSDAFFLLDDSWNFAFINSKAEKLLQRTRDDLLGKNVWREFPEAVGSTFQKEYENAVRDGRQVRFQEYFAPLETWFEVSADPTPAGLAVYFRDVTRQRAQSAHLRLLEAAVSHQNDILMITEAEPIEEPEGPRIVYVNDAFERRTGFARDEVIGQTPRILQGPDTQRGELDRIRRALKTWQPVRAELINYTKSGEPFWLELDIVPLADDSGWFTHWIAVERDITERKKWEQDLQASEERFRLIARAGGSAVWEWDIVHNKQWWSKGLREVFGHLPDPDRTVPTVWSAHVHPDDRQHIDNALEDLRAGRAHFCKERYRFRRADGSWAIVEDRGFPRRGADGQITHVMGSMTDVSEQVETEERLRQAQKMEAVGQLTGGVAHDFNNLLTIMLGNAELLSDRLDEEPSLRDLAETILTTAGRGAELTSRLLSFSRKQTLEPRVVDIGRLIQEMDSLLRRTLPENIDIEIIRGGGLWHANIDTSQLESALLNLALNARDAMPEGGTLTIETTNAALDDDYVAREYDVSAGQYVLIVVSDSGHGIPADVIAQVFEPFFTTKTDGRGSGLGLSMVYGFVKQSGGHIRVYSEPGEGTSVKLYFPRARDKEDRSPQNRIRPRSVGGFETILVVEDDDLVRSHVVSQLESLGYKTIEAAAGRAALEVLEAGTKIDLLFTDVVMPGGMSGRELADAARALRPDLKVLYTSGYTENAIVHDGRLDPGVDLLSKPYRREQLAWKVRAVLDRKSETS